MIGMMVMLWGGLVAHAGIVKDVGPQGRIDLYLPDGKPAPLVVFVHGGAWVTGSKGQYGSIGNELKRRGFAAAIVDYRLTSEENRVRHPAPVQDLAASIDWLVAEGGRRGFDAKNITLVGHSAGAHMAATSCFDPRFAATAKKVKRFVGISGIYDVPAIVKRFPDYRAQFIELAFGPADGWKAASPQFLTLKTSAKWRVVHSAADELVDLAQSAAFADALTKAGTDAKLVKLVGKSHFDSIESALDDDQLKFYRE